MDSVLEDENLYIHAYCQNLSADKALQDCLDWELDFLQELSLFSPEQVPLEDKPALWSTPVSYTHLDVYKRQRKLHCGPAPHWNKWHKFHLP